MGFPIADGASPATLASVVPTGSKNSQAVLLYGADGTPLVQNESWAGVYPVIVRQSAATAAGAIVWGLYNASASKIVYIRAAFTHLFFDGTAAATLMKYEYLKYTGVTAFTGGAAVTPFNKRTSLSGAVVSSARVLDTGLTATGGAAQGPIPIGTQGRVTQTTTNFNENQYAPLWCNLRGTFSEMAIELAQNELFAIRQSAVSVVGDNLVGWLEVGEA